MTNVTSITYGDVPLLDEDGRFSDEFTPQQVLDIYESVAQIEVNISAYLAAMLAKSANLSDVVSPSAARINIGAAAQVHTHQITDVSGLTGALSAKADLVNGVVPTSQIPVRALITAKPVASEAAMLALTEADVQPGDIAIRAQDGAGTFMLIDPDPSKIGSWVLLAVPTDKVTSVNGQTSTVVLQAADVGAATPAQVQAAIDAIQTTIANYEALAAGSKDAAAQSATQAAASALTSSEQATISTSQAGIATSKASDAAASATLSSDKAAASSQSATTSSQQATISTNKAGEAAVSATQALGYRDAAQAAVQPTKANIVSALTDADLSVGGVTKTRTNLFKYPNAETGTTTGWGGDATASRAISTAQKHSGTQSVAVTFAGASAGEYTFQDAAYVVSSGIAGTEIISCWIWAPNGSGLTLQMDEHTGSSLVAARASTAFTGTGAWQRVSVSGAKATASNVMRVIIKTNTAQAITIYVDDTLNETGSRLLPYFDGNSNNAYWDGTQNASVSYALAVSPLVEAKGDMILGAGGSSLAKLAVGADGAIHMADSNAATGISYQSPMPLLKNLLANSSFDSGVGGWLGYGATNSASSGVITNTGTGEIFNPALYQTTQGVVVGHIYYFGARLRVTNAVCSAIQYYDGTAAQFWITSPSQNSWYTPSARWTALTARASAFHIYHCYADAATANGKSMEVDYEIVFDLTDIFGAGKEPTKAEMDAIMARWGGWFAKETPQLFPGYDWLRMTQNAAKNEVANGDFSNGTTGFTTTNGTISVESGYGKQVGDGSGVNQPFYSAFSPAIGSKIYIASDVRSVSGVPSSVQMYSNGNLQTLAGLAAENTWYRLSAIVTTAVLNGTNYVNALWPDAASQSGKIFNVDNVVCLNLTTIFGSGLEPTKTEMDYLLSKYPNSWFNGYVNDLKQGYDPMRRIGRGSPYGVITPRRAGETWTDLDQTIGARVWTSTGTTTSSWVVTDGNTGWRDLSSLLPSTLVKASSVGVCKICRTNNLVELQLRLNPADTLIGVNKTIAIAVGTLVSDGFKRNSYASTGVAEVVGNLGSVYPLSTAQDTRILFTTLTGAWASTDIINASMSWFTNDTWPTAYPGTPTT